MQHSYLAKTVIHIIEYKFYIRPGDLLVHDPANHNRLTVYRNGQIAKVVKQEPIGIVAFLKNKFIEPVMVETTPVVAVEAPTPTSIPVVVPVAPPEPVKEALKRDKAIPQEVPIEEFHKKLEPMAPKEVKKEEPKKVELEKAKTEEGELELQSKS